MAMYRAETTLKCKDFLAEGQTGQRDLLRPTRATPLTNECAGDFAADHRRHARGCKVVDLEMYDHKQF
jgi:hypothetical protein